MTDWIVEICLDHVDIFVGGFRGEVVKWLHGVLEQVCGYAP
jgi:hypothetical protein